MTGDPEWNDYDGVFSSIVEGLELLTYLPVFPLALLLPEEPKMPERSIMVRDVEFTDPVQIPPGFTYRPVVRFDEIGRMTGFAMKLVPVEVKLGRRAELAIVAIVDDCAEISVVGLEVARRVVGRVAALVRRGRPR